jgi:hypothetical protein
MVEHTLHNDVNWVHTSAVASESENEHGIGGTGGGGEDLLGKGRWKHNSICENNIKLRLTTRVNCYLNYALCTS